MSSTARNAGAEIDGGSSGPPPRTENVAGTRTWSDPPVGFPLLLGAVPPLEEPPPFTDAPPLPVVVLGVVEPDVVVGVEAVVGVDAVVDVGVVAVLDDVEPLFDETAVAVVLELLGEDPPHAPRAR